MSFSARAPVSRAGRPRALELRRLPTDARSWRSDAYDACCPSSRQRLQTAQDEVCEILRRGQLLIERDQEERKGREPRHRVELEVRPPDRERPGSSHVAEDLLQPITAAERLDRSGYRRPLE